MAVRSVKWDAATKRMFTGWMYRQLDNTLGQRAPLESKWVNNLVQWRASVIGDGVGDVPFIGASDLPLPLTAIHHDPVLADMIQTLHIPKDFWSVRAINPRGERFAKPTQEFLSAVERRFLKMRQVNIRTLMDVGIHGTGVYKYHYQAKLRKRPSFSNGEQAPVLVPRLETRPLVQHVPLEDFIIPPESTDIDPEAPNYPAQWVAHRFTMRAGRLRHLAREQTPMLPGWDPEALKQILQWEHENHELQRLRREQQSQDEFIPFNNREVTFYEIWLRFDIDDDGVEEDVVVTWHHQSRAIARSMHNPYEHGRRPFVKAIHMPGFGFYGLGMAEMNEWAQLASERILNATVDSATLSNAAMFSFPLGSRIGEDEPLYPGRVFQHAPGERPYVLQMGGTNAGMFQLLTLFSQFSEQRTGVSELRQGNLTNLPDRVPATATNAALSEGSKRFDMILGNLREGALNEIGVGTLQNLAQMSKDDPKWKEWAISTLGAADGQAVGELLDMPAEDIPDIMGVHVTATSSQNNKAQERQQLAVLQQTMAATWPQLIQYAQAVAQIAGDPTPLAQAIQAAHTGTIHLSRKLVEAHDIQNPDDYTPPIPTDNETNRGELGTVLASEEGAVSEDNRQTATSLPTEQALLQSANVDLISLLGSGVGGV